MSIFNGVAGNRGHNPIGAVIHNDAGSQSANAAHYQSWLPGINPENGFAHDYVCSDGTIHAEDDWNCAWHCGDGWGNNEFYSVEVCQSMGDVNVFKANEERALALVASKFKAWGITPNNDTVRLHQEFFATSCPHRSIEIHGGFDATKAYFIRRIGELMNSTDKWIQDAKGWWYRYADGSYPKEQWLKLDAWYYFDSYGYALRNRWGYIKGLWYYFGDDCRMAKGWIKLDGHWYYLNPTVGTKPEGAMLTGWQKIGSYWYFLRPARDGDHPEGSAATEWIRDDLYWYYLLPEKKGSKPECSMALGWEQIGGKWYYFNLDKNCQAIGSMMRCHWITNGNKRYYLKSDGVMAANESVVIDGKEYRFDGSGALKA